ncbi:MAG: hypothetical protein L6R30_10635 [Thermoanaerobaculia bacterium]|nr:hypothetical protein [Thermoanaerobaculia bacterium]
MEEDLVVDLAWSGALNDALKLRTESGAYLVVNGDDSLEDPVLPHIVVGPKNRADVRNERRTNCCEKGGENECDGPVAILEPDEEFAENGSDGRVPCGDGPLGGGDVELVSREEEM